MINDDVILSLLAVCCSMPERSRAGDLARWPQSPGACEPAAGLERTHVHSSAATTARSGDYSVAETVQATRCQQHWLAADPPAGAHDLHGHDLCRRRRPSHRFQVTSQNTCSCFTIAEIYAENILFFYD